MSVPTTPTYDTTPDDLSPEAESDMSFPASDPPSWSQPTIGEGVAEAAAPGTATSGGAATTSQAPSRASAPRRGRRVEATSGPDLIEPPIGGPPTRLRPETVTVLDVPRWTQHIRSLPGLQADGRAAALLLREQGVRVLLSTLEPGAEIGSDAAEEAVLVHVLSGGIIIDWRGDEARARDEELVALPAGGGWRLRADSPGTVLLCTFWEAPAG